MYKIIQKDKFASHIIGSKNNLATDISIVKSNQQILAFEYNQYLMQSVHCTLLTIFLNKFK